MGEEFQSTPTPENIYSCLLSLSLLMCWISNNTRMEWLFQFPGWCLITCSKIRTSTKYPSILQGHHSNHTSIFHILFDSYSLLIELATWTLNPPGTVEIWSATTLYDVLAIFVRPCRACSMRKNCGGLSCHHHKNARRPTTTDRSLC